MDKMENGVEANHVLMACAIVDNRDEIRAHAVIDSGPRDAHSSTRLVPRAITFLCLNLKNHDH